MPTHPKYSAALLAGSSYRNTACMIFTKIHTNIPEMCSAVNMQRQITMKPIQKSPKISLCLAALKAEQEPH